MLSDSDLLLPKLKELAELVLDEENLSSELLTKLFRLLRISQVTENHGAAVKQKLKQYIVHSSASTNASENASIVRFEQKYDFMAQSNPKILNSFLSVVEPFCGQVPSKCTSILPGLDHIPIHKNRFDSKVSLQSSMKVLGLQDIDTQEKNKQGIERSFDHNFDRQTEFDVIRSLLYIFQGISSKHIKYDPKSEAFVLDPNLRLSAPLQDVIYSLCELGWLYLQVSKYVKAMEKSDLTKGLTMQALGFALQHELQDYYRLLAILEQELNVSVSEDTTILSTRLTLLRLRSWLQEPIERMSFLAHLTYGLRSLSGGALLSLLRAHTKHGDAAVSEVAVRIMDKVCVPFYHVLSRWILYGELNDVYFEFFVGINLETEAAVQNVWHDCYFLRRSMVPTFFSQALVNKIFVIGKSINFISRYRPMVSETKGKSDEIFDKKSTRPKGMPKPSVANALGFKQTDFDDVEAFDPTNRHIATVEAKLVKEQVSDSFKSTMSHQEVESALQNLRYGKEGRLNAVVDRVSSSINQKLLEMMLKDFHLYEHLFALKKFVLLGQGDFVTCLMDAVGPELQKPPAKLYRHNLSGILDGSLRSSNAQFEPSFVLNRVLVRLLEARPGDTGWEVFTLDYAIDAPLNAVVRSISGGLI